MVSTTNFSSLPPELMQNIASFLGTPFRASKAVTVRTHEIPYSEIYENFSKRIGTAKCEAVEENSIALNSLSTRTFQYSDEEKLRSICSDLIAEAKLLWGDEVMKGLGPIYSATQYLELEKKIADENFLRICPNLLGNDWHEIEGSQAERAEIARKMLIEKRDSVYILRLSNLGLTRLPPELYGLPNLLKLNVAVNKITSCNIPEGAFPSLRLLDLQKNKLVFIKTADGPYPSLTLLVLDDNELRSFNVKPQAFPSLELLSLEKNQLTSFNFSARAFRSLQTLNISCNKITTFYAAAGTFPSLTHLFLSKNPLTTLNIEAGAIPRFSKKELSDLHSDLNVFHIYKPRHWQYMPPIAILPLWLIGLGSCALTNSWAYYAFCVGGLFKNIIYDQKS